MAPKSKPIANRGSVVPKDNGFRAEMRISRDSTTKGPTRPTREGGEEDLRSGVCAFRWQPRSKREKSELDATKRRNDPSIGLVASYRVNTRWAKIKYWLAQSDKKLIILLVDLCSQYKSLPITTH